jgi:hypothetical protein
MALNPGFQNRLHLPGKPGSLVVFPVEWKAGNQVEVPGLEMLLIKGNRFPGILGVHVVDFGGDPPEVIDPG